MAVSKYEKRGFIDIINLYTDGGCRPNPGSGAIAALLCSHDGGVLHQYSECVGHCTNNQAEYKAVIKGLELSAKYTRGRVICVSDSELLVRQMNGEYRLKDDDLRELFYEVRRVSTPFMEVHFIHSPREHERIRTADKLVNEAHQGRYTNKSFLYT